MELRYIHVVLDELRKYLVNLWMVLMIILFVHLFMPYLNFEYTKAATYTMDNVGVWYWPDPATEITHLGLNQPLFIFQCIISMYGNTKVTPAVHSCHGNFIFFSCCILTIIRKLYKNMKFEG